MCLVHLILMRRRKSHLKCLRSRMPAYNALLTDAFYSGLRVSRGAAKRDR